MKKLLYILMIMSCLGGCSKCKKSTNTTVNGLVLDKVTGNTIANATVFLGIVESTSGGVSATTVDKTTSDAAGRYSFDFTATKGKDYYIIGSNPPHYFETESVSEYPILEDQKNDNFNISLKPIATIKIHVKKIDTSYDSLDVFMHLLEQGTSTGAFGKHIDTNLIYKYQKAGNQYIYIYTQKYNLGTLTYTKYDSLYTYFIPADTTYINLNY